MDIFALVGLAITATVICVLIKEYKPEYAMLVSIGCCVIIFSFVLSNIVPVFDKLKSFLSLIAYKNEYLETVIKALGICYITQLASDTCLDAGQTAIASKVELAGKAAVIVLSVPMFTKLMETVSRLIKI